MVSFIKLNLGMVYPLGAKAEASEGQDPCPGQGCGWPWWTAVSTRGPVGAGAQSEEGSEGDGAGGLEGG